MSTKAKRPIKQRYTAKEVGALLQTDDDNADNASSKRRKTDDVVTTVEFGGKTSSTNITN